MHIEVGMIVPGRAGGIFVTESALVSELRKQPGVTVGVFEFGSRTEHESALERISGRARDFFAYDRLVRHKRPDVVYINSSYNKRALLRDIGYALLSRIHSIALVVKLHGTDAQLVERRPVFWRFLTNLVFRWSAMVVLLSKDEMQRFQSAGFPAKKLCLLRNGLSLERFHRNTVPIFDPPGILFIARFIREKGLLDLLRSARIVLESGRAFRLYCVGDGPIRAEAEALATELHLRENVLFTGQISEEEATRYYLGCTILALPTYFQEGLPMTLLQGAAAGLPMITTRIRAAADYLTEPPNCLWVEPQDPAMLADCICKLLDSTGLRMSMKENNVALARSFASEVVAVEYLRLFRTVSPGSSRRPAVVSHATSPAPSAKEAEVDAG
jgi:glycosyltransferase involved in cell wall biosynthesis